MATAYTDLRGPVSAQDGNIAATRDPSSSDPDDSQVHALVQPGRAHVYPPLNQLERVFGFAQGQRNHPRVSSDPTHSGL
jgi:hypothetical protein